MMRVSEVFGKVRAERVKRSGMDIFWGEGRTGKIIEDGVFMVGNSIFYTALKDGSGLSRDERGELGGVYARNSHRVGWSKLKMKEKAMARHEARKARDRAKAGRWQRSRVWNYLMRKGRAANEDRVTDEVLKGLDAQYDPWNRMMIMMAPTDKDVIDLALKENLSDMAIGIWTGLGLRRVRKIIQQGDGLTLMLKRVIWLMVVLKKYPKRLNDPLYLISWGNTDSGDIWGALNEDPKDDQVKRRIWDLDPDLHDYGSGI